MACFIFGAGGYYGLTQRPAPGDTVIAADGGWRSKAAAQIRGSGYVVESLEAALWCFARHDDFRSVVLAAANLGDDADTTAAIAGQLAGAFWGASGIPAPWLQRLCMADDIRTLAGQLSGQWE